MASEAEKPANGAAESNSTAEGVKERRSFLSSLCMGLGLTGAYGTFLAYAGRFLFPSRTSDTGWQFVTDLKSFKVGHSMTYWSPEGLPIVVSRVGESGTADDFIALSSVCPHLGCRVHWESVKKQYVCPCHNGVFDASGKAIAGPPAAAGQSLSRFPLRVEKGLLFIEVRLHPLV
ncbi:MAG: Rieske 2Fe-2S domain-containing protein [Planctomycetes bacterium]|nr:Rieske 2Fe-2S domain-containing protein [Planctomycetota bacterium]